MTENAVAPTPVTFKSEATLPGLTIFSSKTGSLSLDEQGYLSFEYKGKVYFKARLQDIQYIGFHRHRKYDQFDMLFLRINNKNYRLLFVTQAEFKNFAASNTIGAANENKLAAGVSLTSIAVRRTSALNFMNRNKVNSMLDEMHTSKLQIVESWVKILSPYAKPGSEAYGKRMHRRDAAKTILILGSAFIISFIFALMLITATSEAR